MTQPLPSKIQFHFLVKGFTLKDRAGLKKFLEKIFIKEGRKLDSVDYVFCSDDFLLSINQTFLSHNFYTDILTFDLSESAKVVAEVYISIDRVNANSKKYTTSFKEEIHRVIFHGALHLCGYDDKSTIQKNQMRKKEEEYLARYWKR